MTELHNGRNGKTCAFDDVALPRREPVFGALVLPRPNTLLKSAPHVSTPRLHPPKAALVYEFRQACAGAGVRKLMP